MASAPRKGGMESIPANVCKKDQMVRFAIGIALLVLFAADVGGLLVGLIGTVLAVTAILRFCPAYKLMGRTTCGA